MSGEEGLDARRLEILRRAALNRKLVGRPLQVFAVMLPELEFQAFRPLKSRYLSHLLQMARPHVIRSIRILVHYGLIEVDKGLITVRTYRLASLTQVENAGGVPPVVPKSPV